MTLPAFPAFESDDDDPDSIDDLCWRDVKILRIERMDWCHIWLWVQMADGSERHIDIIKTPRPDKRRGGRIKARVRT